MGSCLSSESRNPPPGSPTTPLGNRRKKGSRKRLGSRNSSFDYRREEQLHRIPGRMFINGSSEVATLFTQQGKKGTNQDAMIVWENFGSRTDTIFCGVFDGHGPFGHLVARRVRDSLPLKLSSHWEVQIKNDDGENLNSMGSMNSEATSLISIDEVPKVSIDLEETDGQPQFFQALRESFLKAFRVMDRELKVYGNIDCFCSGTTAVTLVKQGQDLVIGHVGDSRAILGTRDDDDRLVPVQLTVDLKPNLPAELERIRKCKGRVFALRDEPEVARVWLPHNDSPGLAMARAFGDFCLKDYGLISVPDVSYRRLTEKDEFIVLATDGIWDVLTNEEVVKIVASAPTRASASRKLVESAVRGWKTKYPTSKVDDCAVVCLFLDVDSNDVSTASALDSSEKNTSTGEKAASNGYANVSTAPAVNFSEKNTSTGEEEVSSLSCSPSMSSHSGTILNDEEESGKGSPGLGRGVSKKEASEFEDPKTGKTKPDTGIERSALEGTSHSDDPVPGIEQSAHEGISHSDDRKTEPDPEPEWSALEGVSRVNTLLTLPRLSEESTELHVPKRDKKVARRDGAGNRVVSS